MSYIDLINAFWRYHKRNPVSGGAMQLFFYLCNVNNYYRWSDWFHLSRDTMSSGLGLSPSTIKRCTRELQSSGLLNVQKQRGRLPNKYSIKSALRFPGDPPGDHPRSLRFPPDPPSRLRFPGDPLLKISSRTDKRGEGDTPPLTPPPRQANGKPTPQLFISELKVKRDILVGRLKAVRYRAHESPTGGLQYSDPKDREESKELKRRIRGVEDQMLDG